MKKAKFFEAMRAVCISDLSSGREIPLVYKEKTQPF